MQITATASGLFTRFARAAIASAVALVMTPVFASTADVAEVTLLVGEALVYRLDGSRETLRRGSAIRVGDRIETATNGHVHVRFVDNGAVSVRPDSVFQVQAFQYNPQDPRDNEVRFRVEKGTARSISGAATEADKSRFRLNTPIAAIGVRGTDFIVRADVDGVRASVADGAIVIGALGPGCQVAAFGPCGGADTRELSADMGRQTAEVRSGEQVARIVPGLDAFTTHALADREPGDRYRAMVAARAAGLAAAEPTAAEIQRGNDTSAAALLTLARVNLPELNRPASPDAQMAWGRWGIFASEGEHVSENAVLAIIGRHMTVANEELGLFRADAKGGQSVFSNPDAGKVEFSLTNASASYARGGVTEGADITRGSLQIDFARRAFATGLDLQSNSGIRGELRAGGDIRADGIFVVVDPLQSVKGAVSHNGREAGYLFERNAEGGLFKGITLWGKN